MRFDLKHAASEQIMIVAHRGVSGGNIPCNTIPAYEAALAQGADMIEIDVTASADGTLYVFHPGMEHAHLNQVCDIRKMTDQEIADLRYVNQDDEITPYGIHTLEEVLAHFKGRCYINCDKFWNYPRKISQMIRSFSMTEQILVKTKPEPELLDIIEQYAGDMQYMAILKTDCEEVHDVIKRRKINYIGQEILFANEENPLCSAAYLKKLRHDGILSWANAIVYDYTKVLAGGHSDDMAVQGRMEESWGWLVRRGFDFIQTDWPMMLHEYLKQQKLLYKMRSIPDLRIYRNG